MRATLARAMQSADPPVIIEPREAATACVIWLHGLGADGHDFEPVVPHLGEHAAREVRFVFPQAPMQPVTINGGYVMRAWYDIMEADLGRRADEAGVRSSEQSLRAYIQAETDRGIPHQRIVLAGFSQGGAIALQTGLRLDNPVAGILALSTYLPLEAEARQEANPDNATIPIFMAHGTEDPVIPIEMAERSRDTLKSLGYAVDWRVYPMPHSVSPEEIADIANWLTERLTN